ncbi:tyrosine-type recombinase/integrase [Paraglaciecola aquimarina]|uniref:Tyrosine-type recombinase/integrase n=1 Tax=Paraglaciecola aquimarina TaxID=1235557 RepID=A0ABU3T0M1_9ALTE|nr:tyrosine-type recombinase/integrase [Paraglaciecola aquimarina]MDU0355800.1 tyrosine-type recombinase/integrase [Paraglaciecola aquimarina]
MKDKQLPYLFFRYCKNIEISGGVVGSFHISFVNKGKTTSRILGRYPLLNINAARMEALNQYSAIQKSKNLATKKNTFEYCGELLIWYLNFRLETAGTAIKTKSNIAHQINNILLPSMQNQKLSDLNQVFLAEKWLIPNHSKYKISTLKSSFQCLKAAFNQASKLGYAEPNPLFNVSFGDLTASKVKPKTCKIQSTDLKKLVHKISSFDPMMKMMCLLCLGYLTRNQETTLARWEHFNFNKMLWHIPAENTKTGQGIFHPITPIMLNSLKQYRVWQRYKTRSKFLFPQLRGYKSISESQAAKKVAVLSQKQFSLHDLRKYGSSYLRDMGVDYYIVERILNHKMTVLDQTYIHTSVFNIVRKELEKWHDEFF